MSRLVVGVRTLRGNQGSMYHQVPTIDELPLKVDKVLGDKSFNEINVTTRKSIDLFLQLN